MSEITPNTPNPVREDAYKQQLAAKLGIDPQYIPGSPIWHSEEEIAAIAEMFSNMSGGGSSGGGVLVVGVSPQSEAKNGETKAGPQQTVLVCDKTAGEIWTAAQTGLVIFKYPDNSIEVMVSDAYGEDYGYEFYHGPSGQSFSAAAATDYPTN